VVVAVGAEWVTLALVSCRPREELKVVQGTLELLVDTNNAVLGKVVGFVAMRTMQAGWLGLHVLHIPSTLSAPENGIFVKLWNLMSRQCLYLESALPDMAKGENETSNNRSMPSMFLTKYKNFCLKISSECCKTACMLALP
jgi:hypothetical protein